MKKKSFEIHIPTPWPRLPPLPLPYPPPHKPPSPSPPPPTGPYTEDSPGPSSSASPKREPLSLPGPESVLALPTSPPKKTPPLPWTHQETVNLIQAYQEKWYSLKKGQLKASQWEEVAVTVAARCGFDEPSKTSTQCRHKIEKLRKRYRAERLKPYPNLWQYFELMDQMERGPLPLNARPVAVVKSPNTINNNSNNGNNHNDNYSSMFSGAADYDYNNSDDSDEEWNASYGLEAKKNKSKSINNLVRGEVGVKSGVKNGSKVAMERSFNDGSDRVLRVLRNPMNGKRTRYYEDSDDDNDNDEEEERMQVKEEQEERGNGEGGGGRELAGEIRGFVEKFMKMENKKIEMMRETQRYRMEIEKKRMDMILEAQRKIIDTIGRAFGAHKKANIGQEM
ncbi:Homeodomain-like superfamily protein [Abeliophyllum distichum]|uniref:Homeodomain-like superfamily protein n=1 Tax=Abeliophyllum distichum TaxID=126358 RepID=A0ABD1Q3A8_9LAMI